MDDDKSNLMMARVNVGIAIASLCVAVFALMASSIALLSVDQIKRLACRHLSMSCGYDQVAANLVVVDVNGRERQTTPSDGTELLPYDRMPSSAWDLLIYALGRSRMRPDLDASAGRDPTRACVSVRDLMPMLSHSINSQGANWTWTANFSQPDVALTVPQAPNAPTMSRTIGFEFDATYPKLHRDIAVTLHAKVFKGDLGSGFQNIIPTAEEDYDLSLATDSDRIEVVCPLPSLATGSYHVTLQSHSGEGDWEQAVNPIDLRVLASVPGTDASPPPKGPSAAFP